MVLPGGPPDPRDPCDVLRENPAPAELTPPLTARYLEDLLEEDQLWLRRRIRRRARATGLDPADLHQEVRLSMLRRSTVIEKNNPGLRTWLSRRVEWTVLDMIRRRAADQAVAPDVLEAAAARYAEACAGPDDDATPGRLPVGRLIALGLRPRQAEVVAHRCNDSDIPLKDYAELIRRTPAAVRQDLHRGLTRIENLFELTAREGEVVRAFRRHGSTSAAALALNVTRADFIRTLEDAHKKIDRIFTEREGRP